MRIRELDISGAYEITPEPHTDNRGAFFELYRDDVLTAATGGRLELAQANVSTSRRNVIRGIHFTDVPPGQAKYVTCVSGAIMDVVVDVRIGSPTFGQSEAVRLDDVDRRAMYLTAGLGHAFCALTETTTVMYFCSRIYDPSHDRAISPLDPELGIAWPTPTPILSAKDAQAPTLATLADSDLLPRYIPST